MITLLVSYVYVVIKISYISYLAQIVSDHDLKYENEKILDTWAYDFRTTDWNSAELIGIFVNKNVVLNYNYLPVVNVT